VWTCVCLYVLCSLCCMYMHHAIYTTSLWFSYIKAWPQDALEMVANKFLEDVELEGEAHKQCVTMCQYFHQSVRALSEKYVLCLHQNY